MNYEEQIHQLISRKSALFDIDLYAFANELSELVSDSSFLVIGGAGSIGQAVTKRFLSEI